MDTGIWVWLLSVGGCAAAFTGIGIYAYRREEPMWFWSGTTVKREELTDVEAYNHANGIMWIIYAIPMWVSTVLFLWYPETATILLVLSCTLGLGGLMYAYHKIYQKYKRF